MKKLSILIPAYNEERTILQLLNRLKSLQLPEGLDKELILVNDCSTDKTEELAKLEQDITGTYGSGVSYEDDIVPMNVKKRVDDLQEDMFDLEAKIESNKELFDSNLETRSELLGFTDKSGDVDLIDRIAKARALTEVQELLYDLTKRKKVAYNLRGIFPFGEAYIEIMTTWAKLLKENPEITRRGQVTVNALRGDNPFSPVQGEGFLGQDEVTGE